MCEQTFALLEHMFFYESLLKFFFTESGDFTIGLLNMNNIYQTFITQYMFRKSYLYYNPLVEATIVLFFLLPRDIIHILWTSIKIQFV